ncbi:MAG: Gfo/Idh/MocA family oxidoreductase [Rhodospirillales bacterium]|nr:Gfo/Idh/MocA family oxidoreductase [Rhodospirillales bacterium]MDE2199704.1 Gfo/Idh/MocA family oxidoreductase [Rhodospirillales bacterium]
MAIRFGVVGTAFWGREVHAPGVARAKGAGLAGVWGRNQDAARAIAQHLGVRAFETFDDLLAETDALTMAVPPSVQAGLALRAAEAGKHMILEKPLALTASDAQAIADAMTARGTRSIVFFLRRFVPEIAAAIAAERGGDWRKATVRVHSSVMATASPYAQSVWRQEAGAALWDIGPHVLSVLLPMLGPVERVRAQPEEGGVCVFRTEHRNGATADVSLTLHADPAQVGTSYRFASPTREIALPEPEIDRRGAFTRAVETLAELIEGRLDQHECDVRTGATITSILAAAEQSARAGAAIAVPP